MSTSRLERILKTFLGEILGGEIDNYQMFESSADEDDEEENDQETKSPVPGRRDTFGSPNIGGSYLDTSTVDCKQQRSVMSLCWTLTIF